MDFRQLRIVFFGTPDFAVASLKALLDAGCNVVGVVTAPDKPAGRGRKLQESAVKIFAEEKGLNILQPPKLKAPHFLHELSELRADLQVVVAFRMLPEAVWNAPPLGTVNVHASLLPQYRGAAPIHWAVINGETETGVTTFRLQHEIDTGPLLLQEREPVLPTDTTGTLYARLMDRGAALLVRTVEGLAAGTIEEMPQRADDYLKHAPKISPADAVLDFSQRAGQLHNRVRGFAPAPGAVAQLGGKEIKILESRSEHSEHNAKPGTPDTDGKSYLRFAVADGWLHALVVQPEGKRRMPIADFLRGYRPS